MSTRSRDHRGTIFLDDAEVLGQTPWPDGQFVVRLAAPDCAQNARPGSFAHVTCDPAVPMRRPLSIMRASAREGWIDILYKVVGDGLRHLATRREGDRLSVLGPIGRPFDPDPARTRPLLIGGGVGIPPVVFLAEVMATGASSHRPLAILGSELPFPFDTTQSQDRVPGVAPGIDAGMALLEDLGVPSRLTSLRKIPGCFRGYVTDLARDWLRALDAAALAEVQIFACGPTPMLRAVAALAADFDLPCQVSLEEYMACAVGGCAGCTVLVHTESGPAMKRVCVDGPVFEARSVFGAGPA